MKISIRLFNRIILCGYEYQIYTINPNGIDIKSDHELKYMLINKDNVLSCCNGYFKNNYKKNFFLKYPDKVHGYLFIHNDSSVGYAVVMFRGASDQIVKIRDTDAYLSQIEVFQSFRGNHFAYDMLKIILNKLSEKGIRSFSLACNPTNKPALSLYSKIGFSYKNTIKYIRLIGYNFPQKYI